jgi:tRNA(fMet)-specific endonuclease VapC
MSEIIVDTSAYSYLRRGDKEIQDQLNNASLVVMSPITIGEVTVGCLGGSKEAENREKLDDFLAEPRVFMVNIDADTSERYALITSTLKQQGTPVPSNDVWLAALAWQHGYKILTRDTHFAKIPQVIMVGI